MHIGGSCHRTAGKWISHINPDETEYQNLTFGTVTGGNIDVELDCDEGTMYVKSELGVVFWKDMPKNVPISPHIWMYNRSTVTIL